MPLVHSAPLTRCEWMSEAPRLAWVRVLVLALGLLAFSLGGLEAHWRVQGFRPTVPESLGLWHLWRQQIYPCDGKVVVLAGTSRVSADISIATMRECLPDYRVVQLGIPGDGSCVGLLEDLVDDLEFHGTVICELDTPLLERSRWDGHKDFRNYRPPTLGSLIDFVAKAWLQDRLVCISDPLTLRMLIAKRLLLESSLPKPSNFRRTFSRELRYDFSERNVEEATNPGTDNADAHAAGDPNLLWQNFANDVRDINRMVQRLRSRGGQVVFLRAPSTGAEWIHEQEMHATPARWHRFAQESSAVCIHFKDVLEMRNLKCPDGSHLEYRDAPQFTRALVSRLKFLTGTYCPVREGNPSPDRR
jgi:hypothetical protein